MTNDLVRFEKIRKDRIELLRNVVENVKNNNLNVSIEEINEIIDLDELVIKKYNETNKVMDLIADVTLEITTTDNVEELVKLRSTLNSCINKIKKEIIKRNIEKDEFDRYMSEVSYLRKDVAAYIRYLKREEKLLKIGSYMSKYNDLSIEEMQELKKLLKNEVSYNRRNLKKFGVEVPKEDKKVDEIVVEETSNTEEIFEDIIAEKEKNKKHRKPLSEELGDFHFTFDENRKPRESIENLLKISSFDEVEQEVKEKRKSIKFSDKPLFESVYDVKPRTVVLEDIEPNEEENTNVTKHDVGARYECRSTEPFEYGRSILKNIFIWFINIPICIKNKKYIKMMNSDFNTFYGGEDLKEYMDYFKKKNSILYGLKCIFARTSLQRNQKRMMEIHNECKSYEFAGSVNVR